MTIPSLVKIEKKENPGVRSGDSIYYRHKDHGVCHGVVSGNPGTDGCHVDSEHGTHQVGWGDYVGHRKRAERRLKIIDQGEDGAICEDENGARVFVSGQFPSASGDDGGGLAKAMPSPAMVEPSLAEKAAVCAELAKAGFEPMVDYVRETFGPHFVYRRLDLNKSIDHSAIQSLELMLVEQAGNIARLASAVSALTERISSANRDAVDG